MKTMVIPLVSSCLIFFGSFFAHADENDLSNGVFIFHSPPEWQYSPPVSDDICEEYLGGYAIDCCDQQVPRTDVSLVWWLLLCAWDEPKSWCLNEFGFGAYDPSLFDFAGWGLCSPGGECLELSTPGWPGPLEGTAYVTTGGESWTGNLTPVYWFCGYAYDSGRLPLGLDPQQDFAGWVNCLVPLAEAFPATCLPEFGLFQDGTYCYPQNGPSPVEPTSWGKIKLLYR